jgi:small subunit ribosomal protein S6
LPRNVYEGLFIFDPVRYAREPDVLSRQINQMIESAGGEVLVSRLWEERRLAYPIKGHRKGAYWLTYFRADSSRLQEVHRASQLNEAILRFMFVKIDPRLVDTLVQHALGGPRLRAEEAPAAVAAEEFPPVDAISDLEELDEEEDEE